MVVTFVVKFIGTRVNNCVLLARDFSCFFFLISSKVLVDMGF